MISLHPFKHIQVFGKFFRQSSSSGDMTLHKRLVLFLHHPHLEGWQRVHHSASSKKKMALKPAQFVSQKRGQDKHMNTQRNSSRTYEHNDLKNIAHIHSLQTFPSKQKCQHDDVHMRILIHVRNLIQMKNLVHMRTWILMKNLIWGSYSSQVVS